MGFSVGDALVVIRSIFHPGNGLASVREVWGAGELGIAAASVALLLLVELIQEGRGIRQLFVRQPVAIRWACYYGLALTLLCFGEFGGYQFLYFQF